MRESNAARVGYWLVVALVSIMAVMTVVGMLAAGMRAGEDWLEKRIGIEGKDQGYERQD